MTQFGSLSFRDGGIAEYDRSGDTLVLRAQAFGRSRPGRFVVTFHGVTDVVDSNRWEVRVDRETVSTDGDKCTLALFDAEGATLFAVTYSEATIEVV